MVSTIILFIRADRAGDWNLHLLTFKEMLPLIMLSDHVNYARWGVVYLLDMLQLEEFKLIRISSRSTCRIYCRKLCGKGNCWIIRYFLNGGNFF